jgi:hypothetical protein
VPKLPDFRRHPSSFQVQYRNPNDLKSYAGNARSHSPGQLAKLAASMSAYGFIAPAIINEAGEIIAGHGREAAKNLGLTEIPCVIVRLSEAKQRGYRLADNRIAELASWDIDLLEGELQALSALDLDFSIESTGFEIGEIEELAGVGQRARSGGAADDVLPLTADLPNVSRVGDLWLLGKHRLLCADAYSRAGFDRVLAGELAQLVFTDLPDADAIHGLPYKLKRAHHLDASRATREICDDERLKYLHTLCAHLAAVSTNGSLHFLCTGWQHAKPLLIAGDRIYSELVDLCLWNKPTSEIGTLYRSEHEFICVWKAGTAPHFCDRKRSRSRTNLWTYPSTHDPEARLNEQREVHFPVKPVALVADAIRDCSRRGGLVLDPFAGSGTTLIAAEKNGRKAAAIELDPRRVDVAVRRWQSITGKVAIHADTGTSFVEMEQHHTGAAKTQLENDRQTRGSENG